MIAVRHALLFADFYRFCLRDAATAAPADLDPAAAGWGVAASEQRIAVGTARNDLVETILRRHPGPPPLVAEAEHIVEADLEVPTGVLAMHGRTGPEDELPVTPGRYRVRVSYQPSDPPPGADLDVAGDHYSYVVEMWPSPDPAPLAVVR